MRLLLALVLATGCSGFDGARDDAENEPGEAATLRIDVHPSESDLTVDGEQVPLLSQTFAIDADFAQEPVDLAMKRAVTVAGTVTGYRVTPYGLADLPGEDEPVVGSVGFLLDGTAQGRSTRTDETGWYSLEVVASSTYTLAVVPQDAALPFLAEPIEVLEDEAGEIDLDVDLGEGLPLWGTIVDGEGDPIEGARVQARNDLGITGPITRTDADGHYILRVLPGTYEVLSTGRDNGRDPTIASEAVTVAEEGTAVDLTFPALDLESIGGRVVDASSGGIPSVTVRLEAVALDGYDTFEAMALDATTSSDGNWDARLLPGTWSVQLLPRENQAYAPVDLGTVEVDGAVDLGTTTLPSLATFSGSVVDPEGFPVVNAILTAAELGFGGRKWSFTTGEEGTFSTDLPPVPLEITLTPPSDRTWDLAMTRVTVDPRDAGTPQLTFETGRRLEGRIHLEGTPVPFAVVEVRDAEGRLWALALTDEDGDFSVGVASAPEER